MNRKTTYRKGMATCAMIPFAAFCTPLAAETGTAAFVHPVKPAGLSGTAPSTGNLSAKSLPNYVRQPPIAPATAPAITRVVAKMPASFRMVTKAPISTLKASACPDAHCETDRIAALPEEFEVERLKRTVEVYAGDVDMGRTPSHLSARMGYIRQGKNAAEPTRRGALSLCDRHIDNCRAEINPHEMQLNPIAKELIFNRNRAGKSFDEHVGVKLTYQFR